MSHFSVIVIGPNVEKQLAPYHEFECTGVNDEYVQDVDRTDEAHEQFKKETRTVLKDSTGNLHSFFDDAGNWRPEFSKISDDQAFPGDTRREKFVPPGYDEVVVSPSQVESFASWAADYYGAAFVPFGEQPDLSSTHKYGYTLVDEKGEVVKVINRTNPNKKWDWYQIGGRWSGFLKLKDGALGKLGKRSLLDNGPEIDEDERADITYKSMIDVEGMREAAAKSAGEEWDKVRSFSGDEPWLPWSKLQEAQDRDGYWAQPALKRVVDGMKDPFGEWDQFLQSREDFVEAARDRTGVPFAVVKDDRWSEKGEMGWFGFVHDSCEQRDWNRSFHEMFDALPDDTLITIVDCHI